MEQIKHPKINLSAIQMAFVKCDARFKAWRGSRRLGKTTGMEYSWIRKSLSKPNSVNWYVAQDLATTKELNIPLFEKMVNHKAILDYSKIR